jgi:hypothetical protein
VPEPPFVPDDFLPPRRLETLAFVLEPLGPQHNDRDYAAWSSSLAHIRATPGFEESSWPHEMSLEDNLRDLELHARDFEVRTGFTFTVLDRSDGDVIGCVYIYPVRADASDAGPGAARVRSWVRADHADLDVDLWRAVSDWLDREWPFARVVYAPRP